MPEILDAPLTDKGRQQAMLLQPVVKNMDVKPELILLSTNCRALQTGLLVFQELVDTDIPFLAHELVREQTGIHICDKRRPKSSQAREFPRIDFSMVESDEDSLFRHDHRETNAEVGERIYKFMDWLSCRDEKVVGISSHSGWLLTLLNGICECEDNLKSWFQTGEMRSVKVAFNRK